MFAVKKYFFFFGLVFIIFFVVIKSLANIPNQTDSLFQISQENNYKEIKKMPHIYNFLEGPTGVVFYFLKSIPKKLNLRNTLKIKSQKID